MRLPILFIMLISLIVQHCHAQSKIVGLWGAGNSFATNYITQQVIFKPDGTFKFYDLMHLRGWVVSKGKWKQTGDTVVLNSLSKPYAVSYHGKGKSKTILLEFSTSKWSTMAATVLIDTLHCWVDTNETLTLPRMQLDTLEFREAGIYIGPIVLDSEKVKTSDTIKIHIDDRYGEQLYFNNEKWLQQNGKLYHTFENGGFNMDRFFTKGKISDLRYRK